MKPIWSLLLSVLASAGVMLADWPSFGADPQRTGWARDERLLNTGNVGSLELTWKIKAANEQRELTSLSAPIIADQIRTDKGTKEFVIVAGSSDNVSAIDADSGKVVWRRTFATYGAPVYNPDAMCPCALKATPVVQNGRQKVVCAISSDGKLHSLNIEDGEDRFPPTQFVPAFSKNWSLNLVGGVLYTTISQRCNSALAGVYSINLTAPDQPIHYFQAGRPGIWGKDLDIGNIRPVVFAFEGKEYLAGADKDGRLFLLDTGSYRQPLYRSPLLTNAETNQAGEGFRGAFASWEDNDKTRWLFAPAWGPPRYGIAPFPTTNGDTKRGSLMAFRVEAKNGSPTLTPAWISRDLNVPEPPVIANGVVFALSSGEDVQQVGATCTAPCSRERVNGSGNAVLYALDAATGKELFNSGDTLSSFTHFGGLAVSNGRVFVTTWDGFVYAFGLKQKSDKNL